MAKKFDINTRQGRARRRARPELFNQHTLQPHTAKFIAKRNEKKKPRKENK